MQFFFEMSFEDFCAARGYALDETARRIWRSVAESKFAAIKASSHYHGGVPCADVHDKRGQVLED